MSSVRARAQPPPAPPHLPAAPGPGPTWRFWCPPRQPLLALRLELPTAGGEGGRVCCVGGSSRPQVQQLTWVYLYSHSLLSATSCGFGS
jgi:hypothetical protein